MEWEIGPSLVAVFRLAGEWQIGVQVGSMAEDGSGEGSSWRTKALETLPETDGVHRYVMDPKAADLRLVPLLPDRPVVSRPVQPFTLPPRQRATLFVSTPLWVKVEVGMPWVTLREFPLQRSSDTWFGVSTREGELCYASRTKGVLHLDELNRRVHRAVTPVSIGNGTEEPLHLDRINLPVPYLSLFGDPATGTLWTEAVTFHAGEDAQGVSLEIHAGAPSVPGPGALVSGPRDEPGKGILHRAFDERGIEIPFPHRTLYAGSATEPIPVRVVGSGEGGRANG